MAFVFLIILQLTSLSSAFGQSFSRGNQFAAVNVDARVQVQCPSQVVEYRCRENVLDPVPYDYFVAPAGGISDSLELNVQYFDGTSRSRIIEFDSVRGRSGLINLWMKNTVQRPLLREGINTVTWTILAQGNRINSGTVQVSVTKGQFRTCASEKINSQNPDDCLSQFSFCQTYLESRNYCK